MTQGQVMKRLLKGLASRPWLMMLALLSTLVQAGLVLYLPVLIGRAIDWIGTSGSILGSTINWFMAIWQG